VHCEYVNAVYVLCVCNKALTLVTNGPIKSLIKLLGAIFIFIVYDLLNFLSKYNTKQKGNIYKNTISSYYVIAEHLRTLLLLCIIMLMLYKWLTKSDFLKYFLYSVFNFKH